MFGPILEKYKYNVIKEKQLSIIEKDNVLTEVNKEEKTIYIIQSPRNRIKDFYNCFIEKDINNTFDISKYFFKEYVEFAGIYLVFDVDYNDNTILEKVSKRFNNESDGLFILSCPCIETVAKINDKMIYDYYNENPNPKFNLFYNDEKKQFIFKSEKQFAYIHTFKKMINEFCNQKYHCSTSDYIVNEFERIMLYHMVQNNIDFNCTNVMDLPLLILSNCKKNEIKENEILNIVYFATLIYIVFANIEGLTREIDNYEIIKDFFTNNNN